MKAKILSPIAARLSIGAVKQIIKKTPFGYAASDCLRKGRKEKAAETGAQDFATSALAKANERSQTAGNAFSENRDCHPECRPVFQQDFLHFPAALHGCSYCQAAHPFFVCANARFCYPNVRFPICACTSNAGPYPPAGLVDLQSKPTSAPAGTSLSPALFFYPALWPSSPPLVFVGFVV